jgi:hypothetical protein
MVPCISLTVVIFEVTALWSNEKKDKEQDNKGEIDSELIGKLNLYHIIVY